MKLQDLLREIVPTRLTGPAGQEITGICYDSRKVTPGSLFVAIKGFQSDGHAYIPKALEQGACALLVQDMPQALPDGVTCVQVPDTREALARVAAAWYGHPERELKLIGVTGTNGKTTVTHLIRHMLEQNGEKCGLIGTNGVFFGDVARESARTTPESLELYGILREMRDAGMTCAAMEVSSHSLVLHRVQGLRFAAAAFTNLTQDHLDFHGDMEQYYLAKKLLFDHRRHQHRRQLGCPAGRRVRLREDHPVCPVGGGRTGGKKRPPAARRRAGGGGTGLRHRPHDTGHPRYVFGVQRPHRRWLLSGSGYDAGAGL